MEKKIITAVKCTVKKTGEKDGKGWTIYEVETSDGAKYDSFTLIELNKQIDVEITPNSNPQYNASIRLPKSATGVKFPSKNYAFERKRVALECAVQSAQIAMQPVTTDGILLVAKKFEEYLKDE